MTAKVPHTIQRDGVYYFNKRFPSGMLRLSLNTTSRHQAMQKAGGLALFLTDTERSSMNITTLRLLAADWLSTELDRHYIRRAHEFGSNQYELDAEQEVYGELRDYWKQCYKVRDYIRDIYELGGV